jgi:acetyl esterase
MPLDPFLAPLLANLPPLPDHIDDFDAFRAQETAGADALVDQLMEPGPDVASEQTISIPVEGGVIDLVVFQPFSGGPHPVHLYIHGGGWISGTAHSRATANTCRERAIGADCTVIAIEYRKAPEHRFPTALNDCFAALTWVANHGDQLGIRPELITVGGGSAGANLAAALTLKSRDEGGPAIAFQLLEVPALDLTLASPSLQENGTGYDLTLDAIRELAALYLPSSDDATNPYASPLLAPDLSGLPPAYIMSSEFDPLRDDGARYAEALTAAGVPAQFSLQLGHIHASSAFTKVMQSARDWRDEALTVLLRANRRPATTVG